MLALPAEEKKERAAAQSEDRARDEPGNVSDS